MKATRLVVLLFCAGCVHQPSSSEQSLILTALSGHAEPLPGLLARSRFTVLVFVSPDCHCLAAHSARLNRLAATYTSRGVQFLAVDSEPTTTIQIATAEARKYALQFQLFIDQGARLANAFKAQYATYTLVLDGAGNIHYRGGLDSDIVDLHGDATRYVQNALDDLLAGHEPHRPEGKTLGCVLRRS